MDGETDLIVNEDWLSEKKIDQSSGDFSIEGFEEKNIAVEHLEFRNANKQLQDRQAFYPEDNYLPPCFNDGDCGVDRQTGKRLICCPLGRAKRFYTCMLAKPGFYAPI